jgi:hypothetical protein
LRSLLHEALKDERLRGQQLDRGDAEALDTR